MFLQCKVTKKVDLSERSCQTSHLSKSCPNLTEPKGTFKSQILSIYLSIYLSMALELKLDHALAEAMKQDECRICHAAMLHGAQSVFPRCGSVGSVMYYVTKNSHSTTGNVSFMDFLKPFHQPHMPFKGKMDIASMSKVPDCSCESTNFTILPGKPVILITINDGSCTNDCVEGNGLAQYLCICRYYAD
ncbi:hypothetical protein ROHU_037167 [Labeo rohita]|uniref:Uncharacterized protein n=1 Tax=Labeo rohita TaxID=84645 RepID=A0A498M639_LABRO|nr:hypothetical protein ROHU_037167 [Labeo rohita]